MVDENQAVKRAASRGGKGKITTEKAETQGNSK
jgi:hypothetical protein